NPAFMPLQVHLPGQHRVTFRDNEVIQNVIEHANSEKTTLTAWFHANNSYSEARTLTYGNFPTHWHGRCLTDFPKMPLPTILPNSEHHNNLITEELNYNIADLTQIVENG
ncbi:7886_t:CDS:2, partial [Cetraspora pellucida]